MVTNSGSFVVGENGPLSRQIFIELEIRWQEPERILARCWFFLCCKDAVN